MDKAYSDDEQLRVILLANQPRMFREMLHRALDRTAGVHLVL
jgi:ribonucleotide monophosphatase NagD (HAD superfamily)